MLTRRSLELPSRRKSTGNGRAILYVSHQSADAELRDEPLLRETIEAAGRDCRSLRLRSPRRRRIPPRNDAQADPLSYYGPDYFYTIYGNMLNRPYLGGKTHDILRVVNWLGEYGYDKIHLVAKGWGAVPATFAALLSPSVKEVTLVNALTSYHDLATTEHYLWPVSVFLPNVLRTFDLPDCYRELKKKKLTQIAPFNASEQPVG